MSKPPTFAEELKAWRSGKDITQRQAAEELDVPWRTYVEWEQGRFQPAQLPLIRKLLRLGVIAP